MNEGVSLKLGLTMIFPILIVLLLCLHESSGSPLYNHNDPKTTNRKLHAFLPEVSPSGAPQPFLPLLAPSPLSPFTNTTIPKLSGQCTLNFAAAEKMMGLTSIDCYTLTAPLLANVMCCPQLQATLMVLIGQSSKETNVLALNSTLAEHCLSDIDQILVAQGASDNLKEICSTHPSNLTEGSCPVRSVDEFESITDSSKLITACENMNPVKECCEQTCQNAIMEAASQIASKSSDPLNMDGANVLPLRTTRIEDCKSVVQRWLASKLEPSRVKDVLRGLSNCNVNKVCPLAFPHTRHVAKSCGNGGTNRAACCNAMESYVSHLQKQSLITNLQALDCATILGLKLRKSNVTTDVYSLCRITLQDFSIQAGGNQESGCLLPSLPSDATFDKSSGISFICDLNDRIPAPWPTASQLPASLCNRTVRIPALPAVASAPSSFRDQDLRICFLLVSLMILMMLI